MEGVIASMRRLFAPKQRKTGLPDSDDFIRHHGVHGQVLAITSWFAGLLGFSGCGMHLDLPVTLGSWAACDCGSLIMS